VQAIKYSKGMSEEIETIGHTELGEKNSKVLKQFMTPKYL